MAHTLTPNGQVFDGDTYETKSGSSVSVYETWSVLLPDNSRGTVEKHGFPAGEEFVSGACQSGMSLTHTPIFSSESNAAKWLEAYNNQ